MPNAGAEVGLRYGAAIGADAGAEVENRAEYPRQKKGADIRPHNSADYDLSAFRNFHPIGAVAVKIDAPSMELQKQNIGIVQYR